MQSSTIPIKGFVEGSIKSVESKGRNSTKWPLRVDAQPALNPSIRLDFPLTLRIFEGKTLSFKYLGFAVKFAPT